MKTVIVRLSYCFQQRHTERRGEKKLMKSLVVVNEGRERDANGRLDCGEKKEWRVVAEPSIKW